MTSRGVNENETIEDVKAEGRKLVKEIYEAAKSEETKAWADRYITGEFESGSDIAKMKILRDKLKNNKHTIIELFQKGIRLKNGGN